MTKEELEQFRKYKELEGLKRIKEGAGLLLLHIGPKGEPMDSAKFREAALELWDSIYWHEMGRSEPTAITRLKETNEDLKGISADLEALGYTGRAGMVHCLIAKNQEVIDAHKPLLGR